MMGFGWFRGWQYDGWADRRLRRTGPAEDAGGRRPVGQDPIGCTRAVGYDHSRRQSSPQNPIIP